MCVPLSLCVNTLTCTGDSLGRELASVVCPAELGLLVVFMVFCLFVFSTSTLIRIIANLILELKRCKTLEISEDSL